MGELFARYKVYIILALGIVAALAFWLSISGEEPSNSLLTAEGSDTNISGERGVIDTLLQLQSVSLSGTIFSDPSFAVLQDFGTQIVPESVGRPNPFAPFSLRPTVVATTTATSSATTNTPRPAPRR